MNKLPLVNAFPYEEQSIVRENHSILPVKKPTGLVIKDAIEAARYMAMKRADNGLENHIDDILSSEPNFEHWQKLMPEETPEILAQYKVKNNSSLEISDTIDTINCVLSEGQYLFHGGLWMGQDRDTYITEKPLSTSFCPQVALRNAEFNDKAFNAGAIDLLVLKAVSPTTRVFSYDINDPNYGHEKEVLFSKGAKMTLVETIKISDEYEITDSRHNRKKISINVRIVEIS